MQVPGEKKSKREVNVLFGVACLASGIGKAPVNHFLRSFGHPSVNQQPWARLETLLSSVVHSVWTEVEKLNIAKEVEAISEANELVKDSNRRTLLSVSFDGTWSTRSYCALVGVGTYIGVFSGLPLFTALRCKVCCICEAHQRKMQKEGLFNPVELHDCTKNWNKSSGSMEADLAVEGALKFANYSANVRVGSVVGDGDAKIDKQFDVGLPEHLKNIDRYLDRNHMRLLIPLSNF
jgi:Mutator-like transposase